MCGLFSVQRVALGLAGFPVFGALARDLPGCRHQHRLRARKEPTVPTGYELRSIPPVPFACRFEALNHAALLPPLVPLALSVRPITELARNIFLTPRPVKHEFSRSPTVSPRPSRRRHPRLAEPASRRRRSPSTPAPAPCPRRRPKPTKHPAPPRPAQGAARSD